MFDYKLALATGIDFPLVELKTVIHQPTIREISMIGETDFFLGLQMICLQKTMFFDDPKILDQTTNFEVFITILNEKQMADKKDNVLSVMKMLFPKTLIILTPRSILLNQNEENVIIDEGNFNVLQEVVQEMFCLNKGDQITYNPADSKAKEIANKIMKGRQRVAEIRAKESGGSSMLSQYLSIITVGVGSMSLFDACKLTLYQLYDLVERYSLYTQWDLDARCRLAGGTPDKAAENWMKNIHEKK